MISALLAAVVAAPIIPPSTPVTIEQVRRDPRRWHGKWVKLEGWINRCRSRECALSERLAARRTNEGLTLMFEGQRTFDEWAQSMIPFKARVTARIDATCLVDAVCLGRAPMLRSMIVEVLETNLKFPDEDR